mgnify:CR=1 FL=1
MVKMDGEDGWRRWMEKMDGGKGWRRWMDEEEEWMKERMD